MSRITEKDLKNLVERLNKIAGFDNPEYSTIGAYDLSFAYGGVSLHRYTNKSGGVCDVFRCGHVPKRDLYNRIQAFLTAKDA